MRLQSYDFFLEDLPKHSRNLSIRLRHYHLKAGFHDIGILCRVFGENKSPAVGVGDLRCWHRRLFADNHFARIVARLYNIDTFGESYRSAVDCESHDASLQVVDSGVAGSVHNDSVGRCVY